MFNEWISRNSRMPWLCWIVGLMLVGGPVAQVAVADDPPAGEEAAEDDDSGFGAGRKAAEEKGKGKPKRGANKKDAEKEDDAKKDDAKDGGDEEMKKEDGDDKEDAPPAKPAEEGDDFGAGRENKKSNKIDPADLENDKDMAKYVKLVSKQFKKDEGYYVIATIEQGLEADKAAPADLKNKASAPFKPYERIEFQVLNGKDEAVGFVVKYMSEFEKPWEKRKKPKKPTGGEIVTLPTPKRDFRALRMFEDQADAEAFRNLQQQQRDAALARQEELNKPANRR